MTAPAIAVAVAFAVQTMINLGWIAWRFNQIEAKIDNLRSQSFLHVRHKPAPREFKE